MLLAALASAAVTLGRTRGAALIGRPLDLSIQVRLDSADEASVQCFEADVFHADTRVDGSRVSLQLEPGASPLDATLRIRSSATVDEPVVTVYVRAGCSQRITRRYVLLADFPPDPVGAPQPLPVPAAPPSAAAVAAPAVAASTSAPARPAPALAPAESATAVAAPRSARKTPAADSPSAGASASAGTAAAPVRRKPGGPGASRSRLKLEPFDLLVERDPTLRTSPELLTEPVADPQQRALAAALWRALNAQPQDVLRDTQRMQTLEADLKSLRDLTIKNQASIGELRTQLQKAESERYANWLVYALAALLLLAVCAAVYLWRRATSDSSGSGDWWRRRDAAASRPLDILDEDSLPGHLTRHGVNPTTTPSLDVDLEVDESMFVSLKNTRVAAVPKAAPAPTGVKQVPAPVVEHADFAPSMTGGGRAVNVEELFDIQQQADFFLSLGQHDQAIEVLRTHISDNVETSALAYLDLMKIYHQLDRREAYDKLRDDFNKVFNAQVPVFDAFSDTGSGLEAYQKALSRIEALWPSAKVLEIIEESIFRKPGKGDGEAFDLEAYRELLLLYAMAKDVVERGGGMMDFDVNDVSVSPEGESQPPSLFSNTNIQPLSASLLHGATDSLPGSDDENDLPVLPDISMPRPSPRLGLDINLSELGPEMPALDFMAAGVEPPDSDPPPELGQEPEGTNGGTAPDNNLIDFDLFDASIERDIEPKRPAKR